MQRILVIGPMGAGKSTLAMVLGARLGIDVAHLDALYWRPDWTPVSHAGFVERLAPLVVRESWIIDGTRDVEGLFAEWLERADTVIFLAFSRPRCAWGVARRMLPLAGRRRPELPGHERERFDARHVVGAWRQAGETAERLAGLQRTVGGKLTVLRNPREVKRFLASVERTEPATP